MEGRHARHGRRGAMAEQHQIIGAHPFTIDIDRKPPGMSHTLTLTLDDNLHHWLIGSAVKMDELTRDMSHLLPSRTITAERFAGHAEKMEEAEK